MRPFRRENYGLSNKMGVALFTKSLDRKNSFASFPILKACRDFSLFPAKYQVSGGMSMLSFKCWFARVLPGLVLGGLLSCAVYSIAAATPLSSPHENKSN